MKISRFAADGNVTRVSEIVRRSGEKIRHIRLTDQDKHRVGYEKQGAGRLLDQLMAFRREIASRNVINVYWTTSREMRYGVFD